MKFYTQITDFHTLNADLSAFICVICGKFILLFNATWYYTRQKIFCSLICPKQAKSIKHNKKKSEPRNSDFYRTGLVEKN